MNTTHTIPANFTPIRHSSRVCALALFLILPFVGSLQTLLADEYAAVPFAEGEMKTFPTGGLPSGWTAPDWGKAAFAQGEEQGETFLAITWPHVGTLYPTCTIEIDPAWERLQVATKIRISNLNFGADPGGFMVRITFLNEGGELIRNWDTVIVDRETEWTELVVEAEVPESAAQMKIEPGLYMAAGAVDIGKVSVLVPSWNVTDASKAVRVITSEDPQ